MTAQQVMKALRENGWKLKRIQGSHHVFVKEGRRPVPVPFHGNADLGVKGKQILKQAGIVV